MLLGVCLSRLVTFYMFMLEEKASMGLQPLVHQFWVASMVVAILAITDLQTTIKVAAPEEVPQTYESIPIRCMQEL